MIMNRLADAIDMVIHDKFLLSVTPRIFIWSAKGI